MIPPNLQCTIKALDEDQKERFFHLMERKIVIISDSLSEFSEICALSSALLGFNEVYVYTKLQRKPFLGRTIDTENEEEGFEEVLDRVPTLENGEITLRKNLDLSSILDTYNPNKRQVIFATDNQSIFREIAKNGFRAYLILPYSNVTGVIDSKEAAMLGMEQVGQGNKTVTSTLISCGSFLQKLYLDEVVQIPSCNTIEIGNFDDPRDGAVIVGCGGIGCWHALTYTNSNRKVLLIDPDRYQDYNLNRQWPYLIDGSNANKAECLSRLLNSISGSSKFEYIPERIERVNETTLEDFIVEHTPLYGYMLTDTFISRWFAFDKLSRFQEGNTLRHIVSSASSPFAIFVYKFTLPRDNILGALGTEIIYDMVIDSLSRKGREETLHLFNGLVSESTLNAAERFAEKEGVISCGNVGTPSVVFMDMIAAGLANHILNRKENHLQWYTGEVISQKLDMECNQETNVLTAKLREIARVVYG